MRKALKLSFLRRCIAAQWPLPMLLYEIYNIVHDFSFDATSTDTGQDMKLYRPLLCHFAGKVAEKLPKAKLNAHHRQRQNRGGFDSLGDKKLVDSLLNQRHNHGPSHGIALSSRFATSVLRKGLFLGGREIWCVLFLVVLSILEKCLLTSRARVILTDNTTRLGDHTQNVKDAK
jgi:hypothetical protein